MVERNIQAEQIGELARAVKQLNAEPDRPGTKQACLQVLAERLGWPWEIVRNRVQSLRLRIVPAAHKRPKRKWDIRL